MITNRDARLTLHRLGAALWWPRSLLGGGQDRAGSRMVVTGFRHASFELV